MLVVWLAAGFLGAEQGEDAIASGSSYRTKPRRKSYTLLPQFVQPNPAPLTFKAGVKKLDIEDPGDGSLWIEELFDTTALDEDLMLFAA